MNPDRFERLKAVLGRRQPDLTVLMDRVHKAHNLSAILRNCDAVGVLEAHAVPAEQQRLKAHIQIAAGASKWVKVRTHETTPGAIRCLQGEGFEVVAAHPDEAAIDYRDLDLTRPVALLVGAELKGVSDDALELADRRVSLPMLGMAQSLNVSVATALLLYEAQRQRTAAGLYDHCRIPEPAYSRLLFEWAYPKLARRCRELGERYPSLTDEGRLEALPTFAAGAADLMD